MSDETPTPRARVADGPDVDGALVPPEETADATLVSTDTTQTEFLREPEPLVEPEPHQPSPGLPTVSQTPVAATETEPVVPTDDPAAAAPVAQPVYVAPTPAQTVYVEAPLPPKRKGNRGIGILIALAATVIFTALFALATAIIRYVQGAGFEFDFLTSFEFYLPTIFFFVGFVIVILIANRASWWAHILGSLFVGLLVYFGTIGAGLLIGNVLSSTPSEAAHQFALHLINPLIIAAALIARETAMWMGGPIAARGRRVKAKNVEARAAFDRETSARQADHENAVYGTNYGN